MKKGTTLALIVALAAIASVAYAQSTATQVVMGALTTSGCPSGSQVCFLPYSSANPLPVVSIAR